MTRVNNVSRPIRTFRDKLLLYATHTERSRVPFVSFACRSICYFHCFFRPEPGALFPIAMELSCNAVVGFHWRSIVQIVNFRRQEARGICGEDFGRELFGIRDKD